MITAETMITKKELEEQCNSLKKENTSLMDEIGKLKETIKEIEMSSNCKSNEITRMGKALMQIIGPVVTNIVREKLSVENECDDGTLTTKLLWGDSVFASHYTDVNVYTPCGLDE